MRKASLVGVLFFGLLVISLMIGGGTGCGGGGTNDDANVTNGKVLLAAEKGEQAKTSFNLELAADPNSCGGLYGRVLADVQVLSKKASDLINSGGGLLTTEYQPYASAATSTDLYAIINPVLTPFVTILAEMQKDTDKVVALDCTFQTDSFPVSLYTSASASVPAASAKLSGEWTKVEALMFGGEIHMAMAMVDFISAHNLKVNTATLSNLSSLMDVSDLLSKLQSGSQGDQLIYAARSLGAILEQNPDLLTESPTRWNMMAKVHTEMAEGISEFVLIFDALAQQKGNPADEIIGYTDKNNNGFDAGDELSFGIKQVTVSGGTTMLDGLRIVIPDVFTSSFVQTGINLLNKATVALKAVDSGVSSGGCLVASSNCFGLSDISPLYTVFSNMMGSMLPSILPSIIPSLNIPSIPDVIQVDLTAFFTDPKPIRDFMPVIVNHEFVIEGEVDPAGVGSGAAIVVGDNSHFSNPSIPADCITAQADAVVNPIPYIEFSDPTFNGLLWIRLAPINAMDNVNACVDPTIYTGTQYQVADQYLLNKLIAGLMVSVTTVPTLGVLF